LLQKNGALDSIKAQLRSSIKHFGSSIKHFESREEQTASSLIVISYNKYKSFL